MAIEKKITFRGLDVPKAYHRVGYVGIDYNANRAVFQMETYASKAARDSATIGIGTLSSDAVVLIDVPEVKDDLRDAAKVTAPANPAFSLFRADLNGGMNPQAAAYAALKRRAEFYGAKDV